MVYGHEIRNQFAVTYAKVGNATHALRMVLGEQRACRMKPHTLRARASELLNHYLVRNNAGKSYRITGEEPNARI